MEALPVHINATDIVRPSIIINGEERNQSIKALQLNMGYGDFPMLTLQVVPEAVFDGFAYVQIADEKMDQEAMVEWLSRLDPEQVEKDMLELHGGLEGGDVNSIGAAAIKVITGYLSA